MENEHTETEFKFEVGQAINHVAGGLEAVVVGRSLTAMGSELYGIQAEPEEVRHFRGDFLVAA